MDTDTLVEKQIDEGWKVVEMLLQLGFEVTAAFWLKPSENGKWYFYIVSPVVETEGIIMAYRRLHPLFQLIPPSFGIRPTGIKLIGPSNPIARDVLDIYTRTPGPGGFPIRWRGTYLGNMSIDGAYLYQLPVTTP